jgi:hypothetical protein
MPLPTPSAAHCDFRSALNDTRAPGAPPGPFSAAHVTRAPPPLSSADAAGAPPAGAGSGVASAVPVSLGQDLGQEASLKEDSVL